VAFTADKTILGKTRREVRRLKPLLILLGCAGGATEGRAFSRRLPDGELAV
jgi:hypothetical protein